MTALSNGAVVSLEASGLGRAMVDENGYGYFFDTGAPYTLLFNPGALAGFAERKPARFTVIDGPLDGRTRQYAAEFYHGAVVELAGYRLRFERAVSHPVADDLLEMVFQDVAPGIILGQEMLLEVGFGSLKSRTELFFVQSTCVPNAFELAIPAGREGPFRTVLIEVGGIGEVPAIIDTGAFTGLSVHNDSLYQEQLPSGHHTVTVRTIDGAHMEAVAMMSLKFGVGDRDYRTVATVAPSINGETKVLLGAYFLLQHGFMLAGETLYLGIDELPTCTN
ncbi:MAG: hypothetical protein AAF830_12225 [Pseudomonadota bacterium]